MQSKKGVKQVKRAAKVLQEACEVVKRQHKEKE